MVATIVNLSCFEFSTGLDAYNNVVKLLYYVHMGDEPDKEFRYVRAI